VIFCGLSAAIAKTSANIPHPKIRNGALADVAGLSQESGMIAHIGVQIFRNRAG